MSIVSSPWYFRCQREAWVGLPSDLKWLPEIKIIRLSQVTWGSQNPWSCLGFIVSLCSKGSASYITTLQFYGGASAQCHPLPFTVLHCRRCWSPWSTLPRTFVPMWWKRPTSDKTWFMPALKRFPFHVPLLKMSCWSSLELISLTKLGRFVMLMICSFCEYSWGSCEECCFWLSICDMLGVSNGQWLYIAVHKCLGLDISKIRQPQIRLCYWREYSSLLILLVFFFYRRILIFFLLKSLSLAFINC